MQSINRSSPDTEVRGWLLVLCLVHSLPAMYLAMRRWRWIK